MKRNNQKSSQEDLFQRLKKSSRKGLMTAMQTLLDFALIKIGDLLLFLDSRFQKKKYYTFVVIVSIISITWIIAGIIAISRNNDPEKITQKDVQETMSYTPNSKSSSLKPLYDYYLFENKLDIETMSEMIVSSSQKEGPLQKLYNPEMQKDIQQTDFFQQNDRVIQNEIKKLIQ